MTAKSTKRTKSAKRTTTTRPSKSRAPKAGVFRSLTDIQVYLVLVVVSVITRLPVLKAFDLVTFDGTSYINQAKFLIRGSVGGGAFPVGYPAFITGLLPIVGDGVRAAQIVSFLASVGTAIAVYLLAKKFLEKDKAFFCALAIAVHPLFIRLSLTTFSESLYIFWVCLGLLFYVLNKDLLFGVALGLASITRPEAVAIFGILMLLRMRTPKRLVTPAAMFIVLYALNSVYLSQAVGRPVMLPKSEFFAASADVWQLRETALEYEGREGARQKFIAEAETRSAFSNYVKRLPEELGNLATYVLPTFLILAIFGMFKRRGFLLAALVPLLFIPAFTVRSEPRYLLPYVPILILFGFIGADAIRHKGVRLGAYIIIIASVVANPLINRAQLTDPINPEYVGSKEAGLKFTGRVSSSTRIADRKPFFAFYAGGHYIEIPVAPYDDAMNELVEKDVELLSLHRLTTHLYRPALKPLIYDRPAVMGELRFKQIYYDADGELIYELVRDDDPLQWVRLTDIDGSAQAPTWSPDGQHIAFRAVGEDLRTGIYITKVGDKTARRLADVKGTDDPLTWSPDGSRIAFAAPTSDTHDIVTLDIETGQTTRVTSDRRDDISPSWSPNGKEMAFCSKRTGAYEIWIKDLDTGLLSKLSEGGGNRFPAFSNDGNQIAWLERTDVVVLDRRTGDQHYVVHGNVNYRPTWSPNDRFVAIESDAWGGVGIYIVFADASDALLLTKTRRSVEMPSWNPTANQLAVSSNQDTTMSVFVLSELEDYLQRLEDPPDIKTFEPLPERKTPDS